MKVKLSNMKIQATVQKLNKILDEENILSQEWNKDIIKELILQNLTKNTSLTLIKELEELPISCWND